MRTICTAVLGMLVMLFVPVAVATADTPAVIADRAAQRLIPGPFTHGPDMQVVVNSAWPGQRGRVTLISSDCAGAAALGLVPKYAYRVYRSTKIETSTCATPGDFSDPLPLINKAQRAHYRSRKRRARLTACRMVRTTVRKFWPAGQKPRIRIKCNRIKGFRGSQHEVSLSYYGSGRSHRKVSYLKLQSNGRFTIVWRSKAYRAIQLTGL